MDFFSTWNIGNLYLVKSYFQFHFRDKETCVKVSHKDFPEKNGWQILGTLSDRRKTQIGSSLF